ARAPDRRRARCAARQEDPRSRRRDAPRPDGEVSRLPAGMKCPFCGSEDTQVVDSRVSEAGDSIRRRRRCPACQKRFTTYETAELRLPQIVKQNGTRSDFDVHRIRSGFQRALHKRPVPTEYVDQAVERIVQQVLALGEREIPSRQVGEMVMQELYKLDKVGYIRFASVYRSFQDVADFRDALQEVEPAPARRTPKSTRWPMPPRAVRMRAARLSTSRWNPATTRAEPLPAPMPCSPLAWRAWSPRWPIRIRRRHTVPSVCAQSGSTSTSVCSRTMRARSTPAG